MNAYLISSGNQIFIPYKSHRSEAVRRYLRNNSLSNNYDKANNCFGYNFIEKQYVEAQCYLDGVGFELEEQSQENPRRLQATEELRITGDESIDLIPDEKGKTGSNQFARKNKRGKFIPVPFPMGFAKCWMYFCLAVGVVSYEEQFVSNG